MRLCHDTGKSNNNIQMLVFICIFNFSPFFFYRYLKSVFPTVEEYLLLDVLSNSDNNVQKAAERLVKMGYVSQYLYILHFYINAFQIPKGKLICFFFFCLVLCH